MSDPPLPRYPGGSDPEPSQRDRHQDAQFGVPWVHVASAIAIAVAVAFCLVRLTFRVMPMPVLI